MPGPCDKGPALSHSSSGSATTTQKPRPASTWGRVSRPTAFQLSCRWEHPLADPSQPPGGAAGRRVSAERLRGEARSESGKLEGRELQQEQRPTLSKHLLSVGHGSKSHGLLPPLLRATLCLRGYPHQPVPSHCRWGSGGAGRASHSSEITPLARGRARMDAPASSFSEPRLLSSALPLADGSGGGGRKQPDPVCLCLLPVGHLVTTPCKRSSELEGQERSPSTPQLAGSCPLLSP